MFTLLKIDIDKNDVFIEVNENIGINYMIYLTCSLKNNSNVKLCGSTEKIIHFKLSDSLESKEKDNLIKYLTTLIV